MKYFSFKILLILMVTIGTCGLGISQEHSHEQKIATG